MIRSNNGMKLSSGEREIPEALDNWNQQKIEFFLHQKNIKRKFNFPEASHMGGVWEHYIWFVQWERSYEPFFLKATIGSGDARSTLMAEVEGILNSRPLTLNNSIQSYWFTIFD